ncbi:MAG: ATP-binding cassette domain-containing protein [Rhodothermaceae bacterium]|nr:ATP-binding cassette domain-containing protein [Rhodothermaceae bacterium]
METREYPPIEVRDLTMAYGSFVVMQDIQFTINAGEIFVIMGGSGSGKSTLLKHLIGLKKPAEGKILYDNENFWDMNRRRKNQVRQRMGILYQHGALWSGMTLEENVALPLKEYTNLRRDEIKEIVSLKLSLVGLKGFESFYPAEISGGMNKRAALARAMALDPDILFFDEPSSGLDPISSGRLDDLILRIRESLGTTIIIVSHDLASIFKVADRAIFLDYRVKTMTALGNPIEMKNNPPNEEIYRFLTRNA